MANRPGFWQPAKVDDSSKIKRNESSVSKQFQPNKVKEGNSEWMQASQTDLPQQQFGYTPFKSTSMTSRSTTPVQKDRHSGTLRPGQKANPFEYNPNGFDLPESQSTPKSPHILPSSRPSSTLPVPTIPRSERSRTWGRGVPTMAPHHLRSVSALGGPSHHGTLPIGRSGSRMSEAPMMQVASRYQSYTTLPRPEHMDPMSLNDINGGYYGQMIRHNQGTQQPKMIISRPPSAIPSTIMYPPTSYGPMTAPVNISQESSTPPIGRDLIGWNSLSLLCSIQVLLGLGIFGLGVFRMLQHAKWAIGLELGFGITVLLSGLVGIYAVRQRSFCAAYLSFLISFVNFISSFIPFFLGLFPVLPYAFPNIDQSILINKDEPIEIDLILSLVVAIETLISFVMCICACYSIDNLYKSVNKLRAKTDLQNAFMENSLPNKH